MPTSLCSSLAFIEGIGGPELLMVAFIALLLFGGDKLPGFARTLGKSMRELKKASSEVEREIKKAMEESPEESTPASRPPPPAPAPQILPEPKAPAPGANKADTGR